jgi:hypothetical protein
MSFNISNIRAVIEKYGGVSRKPYFDVIVNPPSFLSTDYARDIQFLATSAQLPGVHLDTIPIRPLGYGTPELRPYDTITQNVTLDILVDVNGAAFDFFHKWIGNINNFAIDRGNSSAGTGLNYYEFAYPSEYEGNIVVKSYDNVEGSNGTSPGVIVQYKFNQAWPVTIGNIDVRWDSDNEINVLPVTFAYNIWTSDKLPYNQTADQTASAVAAPLNGRDIRYVE